MRAALILVAILWAAGYAIADTARPEKAPAAENEQIHISADRLISDTRARLAEFTGNVTASQNGSVIQADSLKIFYRQGVDPGDRRTGESSIEKIVATGNVKITFDDKVAFTRQATYSTDTRVLVLSGPRSRITSGKDSIIGEKITFSRADGNIKVEGGAGKRVEAVFFSGGKGLK